MKKFLFGSIIISSYDKVSFTYISDRQPCFNYKENTPELFHPTAFFRAVICLRKKIALGMVENPYKSIPLKVKYTWASSKAPHQSRNHQAQMLQGYKNPQV